MPRNEQSRILRNTLGFDPNTGERVGRRVNKDAPSIDKALMSAVALHLNENPEKRIGTPQYDISPVHRFARLEITSNTNNGIPISDVHRQYIQPKPSRVRKVGLPVGFTTTACASFSKNVHNDKGYNVRRLVKYGEGNRLAAGDIVVEFYNNYTEICVDSGVYGLELSYEGGQSWHHDFGIQADYEITEGILNEDFKRLKETGEKVTVEFRKRRMEATFNKNTGIYTVQTFFRGEPEFVVSFQDSIDDYTIRERLFPEKLYAKDPYGKPSFKDDVFSWYGQDAQRAYGITWDLVGSSHEDFREV